MYRRVLPLLLTAVLLLSGCTAGQKNMPPFSDTFSRRMRTLSSASTDCRGSQIPLDGVL